MYNKSNDSVRSAMSSGIQWDMVMNFVDGKNDGNGNKYNVRSINDKNHIKQIANTGKNRNDLVCNIYDLEGNCTEYVAEKNNTDDKNPYIYRGSHFFGIASAGQRSSMSGSAEYFRSFRLVLYVL